MAGGSGGGGVVSGGGRGGGVVGGGGGGGGGGPCITAAERRLHASDAMPPKPMAELTRPIRVPENAGDAWEER